MSATPACFNGGKMLHIFAFNDDNRKYETDGTFTNPAAEEALCHGTLFYKIDGSNGMVQVVNDDTLKIYQRLDTRGKEPDNQLIPLPDGKNATEYPGHSYYYNEILENVQGKRLIKRNRAMIDIVDRHRTTFLAFGQEWISVEWIGTMFNSTPNVPHPIAVAIHQEQRVEMEQHSTEENGGDANGTKNGQSAPGIQRTYAGMRKFLIEDCAEQPVEGLIIEHEGVYWKVKSDGFLLPEGISNPFKKNRENSRPPVFLV
ncbi:expressed unknown protein [Seminavis robusta]|uniref:Uncharacterized protein n=1 Tax=Seminavis robusta TaxID=568900 RepID=A0A9N8ELG7_9STRA|nr:expressed unknown protein [Seminavis robusta]|eukprot:Sro1126_g244120.1 n/a (258) ;mRNA; r:30464-31237